ncbi:MAG TPA: hypothetical protein VH234_04560 [Candidatus Saccharimonadales bacterium]|jgi:hypothetical protein|nr:hypothetical protein [Candidatus Saccharimonadales bacterium]
MPQYGIGNFHLSYDVGDNAVTFKFWDPEDVNNTATITVDKKDFPKGIDSPTERAVVDYAFGLIAKDVNKTRDARLKQEASAKVQGQIDAQSKKDAAAADFLANSSDVKTEPDFTTKDGTNVFTAGPPGQDPKGNPVVDPAASSSDSGSSKK